LIYLHVAPWIPFAFIAIRVFITASSALLEIGLFSCLSCLGLYPGRGRRLVGLGHKPSKLAIPGSNPGDRTKLTFSFNE
jgi:hypothetical protein